MNLVTRGCSSYLKKSTIGVFSGVIIYVIFEIVFIQCAYIQ